MYIAVKELEMVKTVHPEKGSPTCRIIGWWWHHQYIYYGGRIHQYTRMYISMIVWLSPVAHERRTNKK